MTSRERVIAAIEHEKTDKIPADLGSSLVTGIHAYSYNELKKLLHITSGRIEIMDTSQMLSKVEDEVIERLGIDVIPLLGAYDALGVRYGVGYKRWRMPDGLLCRVSKDFNAEENPDGSYIIHKGGSVFKMPKDGFYFDAIEPVLHSTRSFTDIEKKFNFCGFREEEENYYQREAKKLVGSEKAIVGEIFATFEIEFYFGYEEGIINLILNKRMIIEFLERLTEMYKKNFQTFKNAVGDAVDIIVIYKDLGSQNGPMVDPKLVREIFMPYMKKLVTYIKENSNYYIMLHACGSIYEFIPDIIDCGFDILNPVQISARDMEPKKLKKEFGKDLCFWGGGVDTQRILPFGSVKDVREQVQRNAEIFSRGGGFIFNPVHNIQAGVPASNIVAAYDEINNYWL